MKEVVALLREAQRVTAICHENPDADTLGAAIAIAIAAERLGKAAEVVSADPPPPLLVLPAAHRPGAARPGAGAGRRRGGRCRATWRAPEAWRPSRPTGWRGLAWPTSTTTSRTPASASAVWVDPTAAATCEMVALLLPELGVAIDQELATVLLTGISQDTHTFAHPNATPRTLRVAAGLRGGGRAAVAAINRTLYVDKPYSTLALWGLMLAGIGQRCDGRIVYASMTNAMLAEAGEEPTAGEGFIDLLGSTKAADVTVLFKEVDEASTRVSVRTSDRADAVAITSAFGGGGHARAAGCTVAGARWPARASRCWPSASGSWPGSMLGVVNLDKPVGPTSHDMVGLLRRLTGSRRIGHAGTLDPLASGVLPILVGGATRFSEELTGGSKRYDAVIRLGATSATDDGEGPIVPGAAPLPDDEAITAALATFVGSFDQLPPAFSARKLGGRTALPGRALRRGTGARPAAGHGPCPRSAVNHA